MRWINMKKSKEWIEKYKKISILALFGIIFGVLCLSICIVGFSYHGTHNVAYAGSSTSTTGVLYNLVDVPNIFSEKMPDVVEYGYLDTSSAFSSDLRTNCIYVAYDGSFPSNMSLSSFYTLHDGYISFRSYASTSFHLYVFVVVDVDGTYYINNGFYAKNMYTTTDSKLFMLWNGGSLTAANINSLQIVNGTYTIYNSYNHNQNVESFVGFYLSNTDQLDLYNFWCNSKQGISVQSPNGAISRDYYPSLYDEAYNEGVSSVVDPFDFGFVGNNFLGDLYNFSGTGSDIATNYNGISSSCPVSARIDVDDYVLSLTVSSNVSYDLMFYPQIPMIYNSYLYYTFAIYTFDDTIPSLYWCFYDVISDDYDSLREIPRTSFIGSNYGIHIFTFKADSLFLEDNFAFAIKYNRTGNFNVGFCKLETGKSFSGYVGRYYSNYGYSQAEEDGVAWYEGYSNGEAKGYKDGYQDGQIVGWNHGYEDAVSSERYSFYDLFGAIYDVPVQTFNGLFDFNILGINIKGFILGLISLCIVLFILKIVFK